MIKNLLKKMFFASMLVLFASSAVFSQTWDTAVQIGSGAPQNATVFGNIITYTTIGGAYSYDIDGTFINSDGVAGYEWSNTSVIRNGDTLAYALLEEEQPGYYNFQVVYSLNGGEDWTEMASVPAGNYEYGYYGTCDLALVNSTLFIAFSYDDHSNWLGKVYWNSVDLPATGGAWDDVLNQIISTYGSYMYYHPQLVTDENGTLHLTYMRANTDIVYYKYTTNKGGSWSSTYSWDTNLTIPNIYKHTLNLTASDGKLCYIHQTDNSGSTSKMAVTVATKGSSTSSTTIVYDSNICTGADVATYNYDDDEFVIAYAANGYTYTNKYSSGSWGTPSVVLDTAPTDLVLCSQPPENLIGLIYKTGASTWIKKEIFYPYPPTSLYVYKSTHYNRLYWTNSVSTDADYYKIRRKIPNCPESEFQAYKSIGTDTSSPNYDDDDEVEDYNDTEDFVYEMTTVDDDGYESVPVEVRDPDYAPNVPTGLVLSWNDYLDINWNANSEDDIASYSINVYSYDYGNDWTRTGITGTYYEETNLEEHTRYGDDVEVKILAKDAGGNSSTYCDIVVIEDGLYKGMGTAFDVNDEGVIPTNFWVNSYPNPFNPTTHIGIGLPEASKVFVEIYNVTGQRVANIQAGFLNAGIHSVRFNATDYPSGTYFFRVIAISGDNVQMNRTGKMILMK